MKSVLKINPEEIIPINEIERAVNKKLTLKIFNNEEIFSIMPAGLQYALQFSATCLVLNGQIDHLPEKLRFYEGSPEFVKHIMNFYDSHKNKLKVPNAHKLIQLYDERGFLHCSVHLGDIVHQQWFLQDILLQSEITAPKNNTFHAKYSGLGNGIFDSILLNLKQQAIYSKVEAICLNAAHPAQKEMFFKRGFISIPGKYTDFAEKKGLGFPLRYKLKN